MLRRSGPGRRISRGSAVGLALLALDHRSGRSIRVGIARPFARILIAVALPACSASATPDPPGPPEAAATSSGSEPGTGTSVPAPDRESGLARAESIDEEEAPGDWLDEALRNLVEEDPPPEAETVSSEDPLADAFGSCEAPEHFDCTCPTGAGYDATRRAWVVFGCDGWNARGHEGTMRQFVEIRDAQRSRRVYSHAITRRALPAIRTALARHLRGVVYPTNRVVSAAWTDELSYHRSVVALTGALEGWLLYFESEAGRTGVLHLVRADRTDDHVLTGGTIAEPSCPEHEGEYAEEDEVAAESEVCSLNSVVAVLVAPDLSSLFVRREEICRYCGDMNPYREFVVALPPSLAAAP